MYRDSDDYFDWLCGLVRAEKQTLHWYEILWVLANYDFEVVHPMDQNRADDALDLRCEYWDGRAICLAVCQEPASVLEVLIALARRGERDIMHDPDLGDRSPKWFWIMMRNLGLDKYAYRGCMRDARNRLEINRILSKFVERRYDKDGNGSIFRATNFSVNMRKEELWRQMNYFFDNFF